MPRARSDQGHRSADALARAMHTLAGSGESFGRGPLAKCREFLFLRRLGRADYRQVLAAYYATESHARRASDDERVIRR
jgi:hypothetical protein